MPDIKPLKVLIEMRPAMDGFAGIPQETRLLFRLLSSLPQLDVGGLLQSSLQFLHPGLPDAQDHSSASPAACLHTYAKVILSLEAKPTGKNLSGVKQYLRRRLAVCKLVLASLVMPASEMRTTRFESTYFEEYLWHKLFAKTLLPDDFTRMTQAHYRVCSTPWNMLQSAGLATRRLFGTTRYPRLDMGEASAFIAQTPYPARLPEKTRLIVRYHDALAIFMPHAFANKERHLATHFHALENNVRDGAYFACVSETSRLALLRLFPDAAARCVTIPNMVSPHYHLENFSPLKAAQIISQRINDQSPHTCPTFADYQNRQAFYGQHLGVTPPRFLLMVATIEPRKNHVLLIQAWRALRENVDAGLKLVIVGNVGWDVAPIMDVMRADIDAGNLFVLHKVPADELRCLYRHALATVSPSLAEGFDYSGIEAMCSGGVVIASDIDVHREIYDDAAQYFDAHSSDSLANAVHNVLYSSQAEPMQAFLRSRSAIVSARYRPEAILPQWERFLSTVVATPESATKTAIA